MAIRKLLGEKVRIRAHSVEAHDSDSKESACNAGDLGSIPGWESPLEKGMATHSSILAWRIPQTEESGGLQSWGHKESDMTERLTLFKTEGKATAREMTTRALREVSGMLGKEGGRDPALDI